MLKVVLLSDRDYTIVKKPAYLRWLPDKYDIDINSNKPVKEFVKLAIKLCKRGFVPFKTSQPPYLESEERLTVIKLGKSNVESDRLLMKRYGTRNQSQWNIRNLEMVMELSNHIDLKRMCWNFHIGFEEDRHKLKKLFSRNGQLFIKSVIKGHASIEDSYEKNISEFGNLENVDSESLMLFVSEVMNIAKIEADINNKIVYRNDEWRHWVYRGKVIATCHAFDCRSDKTSDQYRDLNVRFAKEIAQRLQENKFATTYVLDTCTLEGNDCSVVESNFFFSSGVYDKSVLDPIVDAICG